LTDVRCTDVGKPASANADADVLMSLPMLTKLNAKVILKNVNSRVSGNC